MSVPVGLCETCRYVRIVRSDRGSMFYRCGRAVEDQSFPKYPRLPVLECRGYEQAAMPQAASDPGSQS